MDSNQEYNLIRSVAKLEEVSKMQRLSNQELHAKLDTLLCKVDANEERRKDTLGELKTFHDNDLTPIKKNTFIVIGANKFLLTVFFTIYTFAFWRQINYFIDAQFNVVGLKTDTLPSKRIEYTPKDSSHNNHYYFYYYDTIRTKTERSRRETN